MSDEFSDKQVDSTPAPPPDAAAPLSQQNLSWADMSDEEDDPPVLPTPKDKQNSYQALPAHRQHQQYDRHQGGGRPQGNQGGGRRAGGGGSGYEMYNRDRDRSNETQSKRGGGRGSGGGGNRSRDAGVWHTGRGMRSGRNSGEMGYRLITASQSANSLVGMKSNPMDGGVIPRPKFDLSQVKSVLKAEQPKTRPQSIFGEANPRDEPMIDVINTETESNQNAIVKEPEHGRNLPSSNVADVPQCSVPSFCPSHYQSIRQRNIPQQQDLMAPVFEPKFGVGRMSVMSSESSQNGSVNSGQPPHEDAVQFRQNIRLP